MVSQSNDGGARSRTRRAILDAAMDVLGAEPDGLARRHRRRRRRGAQHVAPVLRRTHRPAAGARPARPRPEQCGHRTRRTRSADRRLRRCAAWSNANWTWARSCRSSTTSPRSRPTRNWPPNSTRATKLIVEVLNRAACQGSAGPPGWPRLVFWALLHAGYEAVKRGSAPRRPDRRRHHGQPRRRHHQSKPAMNQRLSLASQLRSNHVRPVRRRADRPHPTPSVAGARRADAAGAADRRRQHHPGVRAPEHRRGVHARPRRPSCGSSTCTRWCWPHCWS